MDSSARSEFEARRRFHAENVERLKDTWASAARPGIALTRVVGEWQRLAFAHLGLGDLGAAGDAFRQNVRLWHLAYTKRDITEAKVSDARQILGWAVVTGETALEADYARLEASDDGSLTPLGRALWLHFQAAVRGDWHRVRELAAAHVEEDARKAKDEKSVPGAFDAGLALCERDAAGLRKALETMLAAHAAYARRGHLRGHYGALLCKEALDFAILGRRAGLTVEVDPRHHVLPVKFNAVYLGDPAVKDVEVVADPLPAALVG